MSDSISEGKTEQTLKMKLVKTPNGRDSCDVCYFNVKYCPAECGIGLFHYEPSAPIEIEISEEQMKELNRCDHIKAIKKHQETPVTSHDPCPGCEIEWMRIEIKKLKEALETHNQFNNLKNDKDAYLYAVGQWALGVDQEKPVKEDFGL